MKKMVIASDIESFSIIVERDAYVGVKKIAKKAATDFLEVLGKRPEIVDETKKTKSKVILFATVGKSKIVQELEEKKFIELEAINGKNEVFGIFLVENPWEEVEQALVVCGSDKRGTIYGIFHLSERIGVSPLVYWGDVPPVKQDRIVFDNTIEMVSKEPSVRYRGFFINDEWPCFGNWCYEHFGGFNVNMYDHVFELLLRLKGNYLWPAMWTSSFSLDGPGEDNARLADEYGIVMGTSHHEPCMRASEEWDIFKGVDSIYGSAWDYTINKPGLLEYWKDALIRSSKYENIVTIGMRGERDSQLQGTNTLAENIEILKDIITNQDKLIRHYADTIEHQVPRLLAVYKEVERYFYGDDKTQGLKDWQGLDSTILMLCDDNFGHMRFLPDKKMREHKGGYGMYYHLDYHGGPVSYEWINTTPLISIWEQMTEAYEYGVREVWMVNVGDLKGNEFPLSYFMDLAYNYEQWGIGALNSTNSYTEKWVRTQFGAELLEDEIVEIANVLTESVQLVSLRRPEALNSQTFHPVNYMEGNRMLTRVRELINKSLLINNKLSSRNKNIYYSLIERSLQCGMNLLEMQICAGMNEHFARQGKIVANKYRDIVRNAIKYDRELSEKYEKSFSGKWKGMELEHHIGFTKWNEDGCRYPLQISVEPFSSPRMIVSRCDSEKIATKNYGTPDRIVIDDFETGFADYVDLEIANDGIGSFVCEVINDECPWICLSWREKQVFEQEILRISCKREMLSNQVQTHSLILVKGDTKIEVVVSGKNHITSQKKPMIFCEEHGIVSMNASHYYRVFPTCSGEWKVLENYGKIGCGLKVFPVTEDFKLGYGPIAEYRFIIEKSDNYYIEVWSAPLNPKRPSNRMRYGICVNNEEPKIMSSVSDNYEAGEPSNHEWSEGVINQIRKNRTRFYLNKGENRISIQAVDTTFVLEKLIVFRDDLPESYLGPIESSHS